MKMKIKKPFYLIILIALTVLIIGTGAVFATSGSLATSAVSSQTSSIAATDKETAEDATAPELKNPPRINEAFSELTDAQKAEIYKITDSIQSSQSALLDKLVEFGVLDKDTAEEMKTRQSEKYAQDKEDGRLPMGGGPRGGRGGPGGPGGFGGIGGRMNRPDCNVTGPQGAEETSSTITATDSN